MHLIRKGLLQEVTAFMIHHVYQLILLRILSLSPLFFVEGLHDGQGMHIARLPVDHIVLVEPTYNMRANKRRTVWQ